MDSWARAKHNEHGFSGIGDGFEIGAFAAASGFEILNFCIVVEAVSFNLPQNLIKI